MKLYNYWRSTSSWRVRIALNLKNIKFEYVPVHLVKDGGEQYRPEHQSRNPMSQVPVLEWTEDGQTRLLAQSMAIIEYLDETHPEPPLLPKDAFRRAQARMLAEHVNSGIQPLHNAAVIKRVKELQNGREHADHEWAGEWVKRGLAGLEAATRPLAGKFSLGDQVSLPDIYLAPQMYGARRFKVDLSPYPTLVRIEEALNALPAFQAAHPDRQPDAPPPDKR